MNVKDMAKVQSGIKFKRMNCALFAFSAIVDANKNLIAPYLRLSQLIATRTATRDLTGLVEKELLVRQGEKKGTHYLLSPAISEK